MKCQIVTNGTEVELFVLSVSGMKLSMGRWTLTFFVDLAKLTFLGLVHTSKLSWDRLLSFCCLILTFKLFQLCFSNISSTAVECRMVVVAKTKFLWPLNTHYSDTCFNQTLAIK